MTRQFTKQTALQAVKRYQLHSRGKQRPHCPDTTLTRQTGKAWQTFHRVNPVERNLARPSKTNMHLGPASTPLLGTNTEDAPRTIWRYQCIRPSCEVWRYWQAPWCPHIGDWLGKWRCSHIMKCHVVPKARGLSEQTDWFSDVPEVENTKCKGASVQNATFV